MEHMKLSELAAKLTELSHKMPENTIVVSDESSGDMARAWTIADVTVGTWVPFLHGDVCGEYLSDELAEEEYGYIETDLDFSREVPAVSIDSWS